MNIATNSDLDTQIAELDASEKYRETDLASSATARKDGPTPYLIDWVCNYVDLLAAEQYYEDLRYRHEDRARDAGKRVKPQMPRQTKCQFEDFSSEYSGKTVVRFSTKKNCEGFSQGDPVAVQQEDAVGGSAMRGIVYSVAGNSVQVFLNKACNYLDGSSSYTIVKLMDNTTHTRMRLAVQNLTQLKHPVVSLMFGVAEATQEQLTPADINFSNEHLTEDQKEAVAFALASNELAIIHGPPGTGKTTTLVECVLHFVKMGKKVLLCAPTNVAVDNILSLLVCHSHVSAVRLGHPARTDLHACLLDTMLSSSKELPTLRRELQQLELRFTRTGRKDKDLLQNVKRYRSYLKEHEQLVTRDILRACDVVACTLLSAGGTSVLKYLKEEHFDVVIIDENSQAMEAASWVALPWAKKAILAGDHLQLPPTVHSPSPCELELSLMERAIARLHDRCFRMLTVQHRMNARIMRWVSDFMYEGKVSAHTSVADHLLCHLDGVEPNEDTETPLLLVDTAGCRLKEEDVLSSRQNVGEAQIVREVVERLLAAGVSEEAIGIITPYNQQVQLIKQLLEGHTGLEVRSVDGYQGQEKEAIVLSMVRSNLDGDLGFTTDSRRLNVAVSRARRLLCVVADTRTLATCELYQSLFTHMRKHGIVHSAHQYDCVIPPSGGEKKTMGKKSLSADKNENCGSDAEIDKCINMLQEFLKDESRSVCHFPCKLTSYARMRLHSESEKLGLKHYSEGTGDQRHLILEKVASHVAATSLDNLSHSVVEGSDSRSLDDDNNSIKPGDKLLNPELQEYGHCDEVPYEKNDMLNRENDPCKITLDPSALQYDVLGSLLEPHCEITGDEKAEVKMMDSDVPGNEQTNAEPPRSKRHRDRRKADVPRPGAGGSRKGAEETDDEILHRFQQDNKTCAMGSCGKGTELFGQLCQHCRRMYCLAHCIPEVHGCAEAAHVYARSSFQKPPPRPTDPIKHGFVERKLKAKLGEMSQKRKPKKK